MMIIFPFLISSIASKTLCIGVIFSLFILLEIIIVKS
jgi:hypothetical protein